MTTFTYVGKALAYVLATPPGDDDAASRCGGGSGPKRRWPIGPNSSAASGVS